MKSLKTLLIGLFIGGLIPLVSYGQCGELANKCAPRIKPYKSDGQFHRALLLEGETAEFETTFYAGNEYKIVGCTGPHSDTIEFSVYDSRYNLLFSNLDFEMPQEWEFNFNATDKYIIQANLTEGTGSGCAVILIGFKEDAN